jgi:enoyl-CoA hydratase/carnithine racemase
MLKDSDASLAVSELNQGAFPMSNGLTRMQSRFLAEPEKLDEVFGDKKTFDTDEAEEIGLITFAPDDLDWEDEIRVAIEERTSLVARRTDRHGSVASFRWPGNDGHKDLRPPDGLAKLDLPTAERCWTRRCADQLWETNAGALRLQENIAADYTGQKDGFTRI